MEKEFNENKFINYNKSKTTQQNIDIEQNKENKNENIQKIIKFEISSSNKNSNFQKIEQNKQANNLQISSSHQANIHNAQLFSMNSSNQKPKQIFQISSSHQNNNSSTQGFLKTKQIFEISKQPSVISNSKSLSITGKEKQKQVLQIAKIILKLV